MARTWTQEEIIKWKNVRDKQRINQGLPPFDELTSNEKETALKEQRKELFQSTLLTVKSAAWPLGRRPSSAYPAPRSGTLELPRYLSASECDRLKFKVGDDLNLLTFRHYDEGAESLKSSGSNFVTDGSIQPKRHEYLGPSLNVAGYRFSQGVAEIKFWDDYLKTMWIGKQQWDVELEFDPAVESWFVVE
ncbi:hypothetical protein M413DRAFT_448108 [Hebeloma cylindrosporum]|uniref:Uncharacterized protein n=1 Tax=Hebeloma cylindrosporum TaxID=76867 RepID=A0A0C3BN97_HEBCY|nr:hypothetical protein M413DRAFT_448108 [Hebeloma cylindrosporum h7]